MWWSPHYRVRFGQAYLLGLVGCALGAFITIILRTTPRNGWDVTLIGALFSNVIFAATLAAGVEPGTSVLWGSRRRRSVTHDPASKRG